MKSSESKKSRRNFFSKSAFLLAPLAFFNIKNSSASNLEKASSASSQSTEDRLAALEHEIVRLQAINEIQNLMGRYEAIHVGNYIEKTWEVYAQHTPDTWMDISNWGVFKGIDSIKRAWTQGKMGVTKMTDESMANVEAQQGGMASGSGQMKMIAEHHLTTPVIQVATDGQTAKGIWFSPGVEGSQWAFGKYAIDFVKEDGQWRIWHLKWFRTFLTPFDQCWSESQDPAPLGDRGADEPIKYHKPYNSDDWANEPVPPAPKPYDTYTAADDGWQYDINENWGEGTILSVPE